MISVAMITRNEEAAIGKVIEDIRRAVAGLDAEIVVVDSSSDGTAAVAARLGARVVRQFPPKGYGPAMERALRESRGDVVVTLDCDDTYPAEEIPALAGQVLRGECDMVNASRLECKPASMPAANYIANRAFCVAAAILLWAPFTDLHSGMRAYSRKLIDSLEFDADGPALPVELLLKPAMLGFRVREVFIPYRDRIGATTLNKWSSTVWTMKRILRLVPLRFRAARRPGMERAA